SEGCGRASTTVGEMIPSRTFSPTPSDWVRVVFPAPRAPVRISRSPARSWVPSAVPSASVAARSVSCTVNSLAVSLTGFSPAALDVVARHARGDAGDDLVVDGVRGVGPGVDALAALAENDGLGTQEVRRVNVRAQVDDALVHGDAAAHRVGLAVDGHRGSGG